MFCSYADVALEPTARPLVVRKNKRILKQKKKGVCCYRRVLSRYLLLAESSRDCRLLLSAIDSRYPIAIRCYRHVPAA